MACFSMPLEGSSILAPPYRTSLHPVHGRCRSQVVTSRSRRARLQRRTSTVVAGSAVVDVSVSDDLSECSSAQATLVGLESDAAALLAAAVKDAETELSVLLCTDTFIRDLNAKWRGLEKATDVLSFPQEDGVVRLERRRSNSRRRKGKLRLLTTTGIFTCVGARRRSYFCRHCLETGRGTESFSAGGDSHSSRSRLVAFAWVRSRDEQRRPRGGTLGSALGFAALDLDITATTEIPWMCLRRG